MRILLLGATGLVGSHALGRALSNDKVDLVIAPTREPLRAHMRLMNPVSRDLLKLLPEVASWEGTAMICATGTTMRKAGSKAAFYKIDHDLPLAFAQAAHAAGADTLALVSARGASLDSRFFYPRVKAEIERDLEKVGFRSLTVLRPGLISGRQRETRFIESLLVRLSDILSPVLPESFRTSSARTIADALVNAALTGESGYHCRTGSEVGG